MADPEIFKPIKNIGYFIMGLGFCGFLMHVIGLSDPRYTIEFRCFVLGISALFLLLGFGVTFRKKWGFYGLKLFLYSLYGFFPIGTYYAKQTFKYIGTYNIKRYFK